MSANPSTHVLRAPFALHAAATSTPCTFEGYGSVFGPLIDAFMPTRVAHGAFTKTLADTNQRPRVKILWQHDPAEPIGKPLELREDAHGLFLRAQLSSTPRGQEAAQLLRDGVLDGLSIGFDPVDFYIDRSGSEPIRVLTDVRLWEVSLVTFAANPQARITQVHRRGQSELSRAIDEAEQRYHAYRKSQLLSLQLDYLDALRPRVR
jgi:HK97 family phage prohead protease